MPNTTTIVDGQKLTAYHTVAIESGSLESDTFAMPSNRNWCEARDKLVYKYAWAIPTWEAIDTIKRYSPNGVVEIGAGGGYWATLLRKRGVHVDAYDIQDGHYWEKAAKWARVEKGGPENAARHSTSTLFLCWPPYSDPMAYEALMAYEGSTLVYVGEGNGGCTGDERFFDLLEAEWDLISALTIPRFYGIHDALYVYRRTLRRKRTRRKSSDERDVRDVDLAL